MEHLQNKGFEIFANYKILFVLLKVVSNYKILFLAVLCHVQHTTLGIEPAFFCQPSLQ